AAVDRAAQLTGLWLSARRPDAADVDGRREELALGLREEPHPIAAGREVDHRDLDELLFGAIDGEDDLARLARLAELGELAVDPPLELIEESAELELGGRALDLLGEALPEEVAALVEFRGRLVGDAEAAPDVVGLAVLHHQRHLVVFE